LTGQIWPKRFHQRGGKGEGEFLVDGRLYNLLKVASVHAIQREELSDEGEEASTLNWRVSIHHEASRGHPWEKALEADSNPIGQVKIWLATGCQKRTGLLGQHGMGPGLRAGEAKSTS
jgi:hypothetical protein